MTSAPEVTLRVGPDEAAPRDASSEAGLESNPRARSRSLRSFLGAAIRQLLARNGLVLNRVERGGPPTLAEYLGGVEQRTGRIRRVYQLDSDPDTLRILASVFDPEIITSIATDAAAGPSEHAIVCVPARTVATDTALAAQLQRAAVVLVRARLVDLHALRCDLSELNLHLRRQGFELWDVLGRATGALLSAGSENLYLAYERYPGRETATRERSFRVAAATHQFSNPIARTGVLIQPSGRGAFGFEGGVYNPGVVETPAGVVLLARGEKQSWPVQKHSPRAFLDSAAPLLLQLDEQFQISRRLPVQIRRAAGLAPTRFEDFRLFVHDGRVYANHTGIVCDRHPAESGLVRPESLPTAVNLSSFDPVDGTLTHLGPLALDRPAERIEKNWAIFSTGQSAHLLYSFNPYRLFVAAEFPSLRFATAVEQSLDLPLPDDGLALRNSINPVPYDADHFLHLVHKVYPGKQYVYWAVLINRRTLRPTRMTSRPILHRASADGAAIVYACSAIVRSDEVVLFGGVDDCAIAAWRIARTTLDQHWTSIA